MQQNAPTLKSCCKLLHWAGKAYLLVWRILLHLAGCLENTRWGLGLKSQFCASQKTALKTSKLRVWSRIEIQHFTRESFTDFSLKQTETPNC